MPAGRPAGLQGGVGCSPPQAGAGRASRARTGGSRVFVGCANCIRSWLATPARSPGPSPLLGCAIDIRQWLATPARSPCPTTHLWYPVGGRAGGAGRCCKGSPDGLPAPPSGGQRPPPQHEFAACGLGAPLQSYPDNTLIGLTDDFIAWQFIRVMRNNDFIIYGLIAQSVRIYHEYRE